MAARRADLAGRRFGKLVAVRPHGKTTEGAIVWLCRCDCGGERLMPAGQFNLGRVRHCGCSERERRKKNAQQMAERRARQKAALPAVPIKRPNNGPLDVFLYAHPAPAKFVDGDDFNLNGSYLKVASPPVFAKLPLGEAP